MQRRRSARARGTRLPSPTIKSAGTTANVLVSRAPVYVSTPVGVHALAAEPAQAVFNSRRCIADTPCQYQALLQRNAASVPGITSPILCQCRAPCRCQCRAPCT
eukprot:1122857-Rhodomonas_salina.1